MLGYKEATHQSTRPFHYHQATTEVYTMPKFVKGLWEAEAVEVLRSYQTVVAFKLNGTVYRDKMKYSQTTTRQTNRYIKETVPSYDYVIEVDHDTFKTLLNNMGINIIKWGVISWRKKPCKTSLKN